MGYLHVVLLLGAHLCVTSAEVMAYCDLSMPPSREDPNIVLDTVENQARFAYPREAIQAALGRNDAQRAFVESQGLIANATHRADPREQIRNPIQKRPPGRQYDAPMITKPMCESYETHAIGIFNETDNSFCRLPEGQEIPYTVCSNAECDKEPSFSSVERYYCSAESFLMHTVMAYCYGLNGPVENDGLTLVTFKIPAQCTCRKYSCNLDGMMK